MNCGRKAHVLLVSAQVSLSVGCSAFSDNVGTDVGGELISFDLKAIRGNFEGLRYGLKTLDDGRFGNGVFALRLGYNPVGYHMTIENLTDFPLWLNWRRCALVDSQAWTHSILCPELYDEVIARQLDKGEILIAPYAKRFAAMLPRTSSARRQRRPGSGGSFHPRLKDIPKDGVTERMILSIQYREEELRYDIEIAWRLKETEH